MSVRARLTGQTTTATGNITTDDASDALGRQEGAGTSTATTTATITTTATSPTATTPSGTTGVSGSTGTTTTAGTSETRETNRGQASRLIDGGSTSEQRQRVAFETRSPRATTANERRALMESVDRAINRGVSQRSYRRAVRDTLVKKQAELHKLLAKTPPLAAADAKALAVMATDLARDIHRFGLCDPDITTAMAALRDQAVDELARAAGIKLQIVRAGGRIIGVQTDATQPSQAQKQALADARLLCFQVELLSAEAPSTMSRQDIRLAGLREGLLRRCFGVPVGGTLPPEPQRIDLPFIAQALALVDAAAAQKCALPPALLDDLTRVVAALDQAPPGVAGLAAVGYLTLPELAIPGLPAVTTPSLSVDTGALADSGAAIANAMAPARAVLLGALAQDPTQAATSIASLTQAYAQGTAQLQQVLNALKPEAVVPEQQVAQLYEQGLALYDQVIASIPTTPAGGRTPGAALDRAVANAPSVPAATRTTVEQGYAALRQGLLAAGLPVQSLPSTQAVGAATDQAVTSTNAGRTGLPSGATLDTATNSTLTQLREQRPPTSTQVTETMTSAVTQVQASLFPYTLPAPVVYDDGAGTRVTIPAGSRVSSTPDGYVVEIPESSGGMTLATGGTTCQARAATIRLGPDASFLEASELTGSSNGTNARVTGLCTRVENGTGATNVAAERAELDMTSGKLVLTEVTFAQQGAGATDVGAGSARFSGDGSQLGATNVRLSQRSSAASTQLSAAGSNVTASSAQGVMSAGSVELTVTRNADKSGIATMTAHDLVVKNGDTVLSAATADVTQQVARDGSSELTFKAGDAILETGGRRVETKGTTVASLSQDKNGTLRSVELTSEQVHVAGQGQTIDAETGTLRVAYDAQGKLEHASVTATTVAYDDPTSKVRLTGGQALDIAFVDGKPSQIQAAGGELTAERADGQKLSITDGELALQLDNAGRLTAARAQAGTATLETKQGKLQISDGAAFSLDAQDGRITRLDATAGTARFEGPKGVLEAKGAAADVRLDEQGLLREAKVGVGSLSFTGPQGSLSLTDGAEAKMRAEGGVLRQVELTAGRAIIGTKTGDEVAITGAKAQATFDAQGLLTNATADVGAVQLAGSQGVASGEKLSVTFSRTANGTRALATLDHGVFEGTAGKLEIKNASFEAVQRPDGSLASIKAGGSDLAFTGTSAFGQATTVALARADAVFTTNADGSQGLVFSGASAKMTMQGGRELQVEQLERLEIKADAQGRLTNVDLSMPGQVNFTEQANGIAVNAQNIQAHADPTRIAGSFTQAGLVLSGQGVTATLKGGAAELTTQANGGRQARLHIAEASVLKQLEGQLGFQAQVESLDVVVKAGAGGALQSAELSLGNLTASAEQMNVFVKTPTGERLRLNVSFSPDGKELREVFWQVPEGGEIKVSSDDVSASMTAQTVRLSRDAGGTIRFDSQNFNVDAKLKDTKVKVDSDRIDVSLNPRTGAIVFNKVSGTTIKVEKGDMKVDVDIKALDNLMLRLTGISGAAQGACLSLTPTADGSRLTAKVVANVNGIPLAVEFDDVRELIAAATLRENQVQVLVADPTGQGNISIEASGFKFSGSKLEVFARYRKFESRRLLESVGSYLSREGTRLTRCIQMETDGVVRIGTTKPGIQAELAVLMPVGVPGGDAPTYRWDLGDTRDRGGAGAIVSLGGQGTTRSGTEYVGSVFFGAVPGSYVEVDATTSDGKLSLYGIPLPKRFTLPTTMVAGFTFQRNTNQSRLSVGAGAFVNAASFAPADETVSLPSQAASLGMGSTLRVGDYLREPTMGGGFVGVNYQRNNVHATLEGSVEVNRQRQISGGAVRLKIGIDF